MVCIVIYIYFIFSYTKIIIGVTWGHAGYVKISRSDSTNDAGICGIAMDPSFPPV